MSRLNYSQLLLLSSSGNNSCLPCHSTCKECSSERLCESCARGYELHQDTCVAAKDNININTFVVVLTVISAFVLLLVIVAIVYACKLHHLSWFNNVKYDPLSRDEDDLVKSDLVKPYKDEPDSVGYTIQ